MADSEMHVLQGNLASDPVLKKLQNGRSLCKMRLPVGVYRMENGERKKVDTTFYTITAFGDYADFLAGALHKGSPVKVYGTNLKARQYKTNEGEHRVDLEIEVNNGDVTVVQYAPRKARTEPHQEELVPQEEPEADGEEDADIPF